MTLILVVCELMN